MNKARTYKVGNIVKLWNDPIKYEVLEVFKGKYSTQYFLLDKNASDFTLGSYHDTNEIEKYIGEKNIKVKKV